MQSLETAPHTHHSPNIVYKHRLLHTYPQPYISEFDTICRRDLPLWCIAGKITARIKCSYHKSKTSLTRAKPDRKCIDIRMYWLQICLLLYTGTVVCVMRNWGLRKGDKVEPVMEGGWSENSTITPSDDFSRNLLLRGFVAAIVYGRLRLEPICFSSFMFSGELM